MSKQNDASIDRAIAITITGKDARRKLIPTKKGRLL
jgi:hypothetical protein